jgi:hypothetical protein
MRCHLPPIVGVYRFDLLDERVNDYRTGDSIPYNSGAADSTSKVSHARFTGS